MFCSSINRRATKAMSFNIFICTHIQSFTRKEKTLTIHTSTFFKSWKFPGNWMLCLLSKETSNVIKNYATKNIYIVKEKTEQSTF